MKNDKIQLILLTLLGISMLVLTFFATSNRIYINEEKSSYNNIDLMRDNYLEGKSIQELTEIINNGYFYSCDDIVNICSNNPDITGCYKYCSNID